VKSIQGLLFPLGLERYREYSKTFFSISSMHHNVL
jgi:hypothetical protein